MANSTVKLIVKATPRKQRLFAAAVVLAGRNYQVRRSPLTAHEEALVLKQLVEGWYSESVLRYNSPLLYNSSAWCALRVAHDTHAEHYAKEVLWKPEYKVAASRDAQDVAHHVYETESWAELPYVADAAEDCSLIPEVVEHLRSHGPHVRGCWALDLILRRL